MRYVLGLDGGGSKTVCLVADETGRVLGRGRGGPSNAVYVPHAEALASVSGAVSGALASAGLLPEQVAILCASLPMGPAALAQALSPPLPERVRRAAEGATARWAACPWVPGHVGVTVDGGTGSLARGWSRDGREAGAGGWGVVLGDEGSGYWIGLQALIAVIQAYDGRRAPTLLTAAALEHFAAAGVPALAACVAGVPTSAFAAGPAGPPPIEFVADSGPVVNPGGGQEPDAAREGGLLYVPASGARPLWRHEIAGFCLAVAEAARRGDEAAQAILHAAGRELGRLGAAVIERLAMGGEAFAVVPFGGVFQIGAAIDDPFRAVIQRAAPRAAIVRARYAPEVGAVLLALDALDIAATPAVIANLEQAAKA